jgi:MFS transporter, FSR family, fosmidomycin resistance protein
MTRRDKTTFAVLCAGHFVSDSYSSIIYPLLPLIKIKLGLSAAQVFWLAPLIAISSSLMQPVYGIISDRYFRRFFAVFGPAITAIFVSMIGLAPSYSMLIVLLIAGGIGIGSFHPQGAAMASIAAADRRRVGMALFSAIGTLGFALGPIGITRVVSAYGLEHSYYVIGAGLLMSAILYRACPPLPAMERKTAGVATVKWQLISALRPVWKPLTLLYLITVIRSGLQMTTNNYLPFMLEDQGHTLTHIGNVMTVFLLLGGIGGIAGGFTAERFSGRSVTLISGLLAGPLMIGAFAFSGPLSIVCLGLGGFTLLATIPVIVAMAQELVPGQTSTVSALMMGAAWGIGALAPQALSGFVTSYGFRNTLIGASAVTMLAALLAYFLPREEPAQRPVESDLAIASAVGD